jgi:transposase
VSTLVRELKIELRDPLEHAYLPLEYEPGNDAQVDFFEAEDLDRGRIKTFVLLVRACYSARTFVYAAPNQTQESLMEGLMQAFAFFGGVFPRLWFDNLTPSVRKVLKGRDRIMQKSLGLPTFVWVDQRIRHPSG